MNSYEKWQQNKGNCARDRLCNNNFVSIKEMVHFSIFLELLIHKLILKTDET